MFESTNFFWRQIDKGRHRPLIVFFTIVFLSLSVIITEAADLMLWKDESFGQSNIVFVRGTEFWMANEIAKPFEFADYSISENSKVLKTNDFIKNTPPKINFAFLKKRVSGESKVYFVNITKDGNDYSAAIYKICPENNQQLLKNTSSLNFPILRDKTVENMKAFLYGFPEQKKQIQPSNNPIINNNINITVKKDKNGYFPCGKTFAKAPNYPYPPKLY